MFPPPRGISTDLFPHKFTKQITRISIALVLLIRPFTSFPIRAPKEIHRKMKTEPGSKPFLLLFRFKICIQAETLPSDGRSEKNYSHHANTHTEGITEQHCLAVVSARKLPIRSFRQFLNTVKPPFTLCVTFKNHINDIQAKCKIHIVPIEQSNYCLIAFI